MIQIIKVDNFEYHVNNTETIEATVYKKDDPWDYFDPTICNVVNTLPKDAIILALPDEYICYGNHVGKFGLLKLHNFRITILENLPKSVDLSSAYGLFKHYNPTTSEFTAIWINLSLPFEKIKTLSNEPHFFYTYAISQVGQDE